LTDQLIYIALYYYFRFLHVNLWYWDANSKKKQIW